MAQGKKSFVLYCDIKHTIDHLSNEQAGILFKHIVDYVNDTDPQTDNIIIKLAFEPIKQQLKRHLRQWEEIREKRSEAGKLGGRPKKQTEAKKANAFSEKQTEAKKAVSVSVSVSDNVNDNVIERENTAHTDFLKGSNLFKQPTIPTKQQVLEAIVNAGGNKEMAKSFYEKHDSTGWFIQGSPIQNYVALVNKFVDSWRRNEKKDKTKSSSSAPPLSKL